MAGRDEYYSTSEHDFIKRNYKKFTNRQLASKLKRTVESVRQYKYRHGFKSKEMAIKSRIQTFKSREVKEKRKLKLQEINERLLDGRESIEKEQSLLSEMKALINLCELTDNKAIRSRAKIKLMQLSEIPKDNEYGLEYTNRTLN